MKTKILCIWTLLVAAISCSDAGSTPGTEDSGVGGSTTDSNDDSDSATETTSGADSDADVDSDADTDSDNDADADSDTDTDADTDTDSDTFPYYEPWSFAVMGDSRGNLWGVNTEVLSKLVSAVIEQGVDLVVFTGDVVDGVVFLRFQLPTWLDTMKPLWEAGVMVYPTRGNHEAIGLNLDALGTWQDAFVGNRALPTNGPAGHRKVTYSTTHKNALFISLDQYINAHRVPQDWLDEQLAEKEVPHLFVFGHEPAFKTQHADCLDDFPALRNEFWESLGAAGGRTYFCGHDHFYDHARVDDGDGDPHNDLHQYIVGTGGADPRNWSPPYNGANSSMTLEQIDHIEDYGYVLVEVNGLDIAITWYGIEGDEGESWSYTAVP